MARPVGLELFQNTFRGHENQFVLIGGTATYLATEEAGLPLGRVTKDLDIVLIVEALDVNFAKSFWSFIKAGAYENKMKGDDGRQFYRFSQPQTSGYPKEIELFSRKQDISRISWWMGSRVILRLLHLMMRYQVFSYLAW